jgi:hypothetical protein
MLGVETSVSTGSLQQITEWPLPVVFELVPQCCSQGVEAPSCRVHIDALAEHKAATLLPGGEMLVVPEKLCGLWVYMDELCTHKQDTIPLNLVALQALYLLFEGSNDQDPEAASQLASLGYKKTLRGHIVFRFPNVPEGHERRRQLVQLIRSRYGPEAGETQFVAIVS